MPDTLEAPPVAPSGGIESMIAAKFSPPVETPPAPATPPAAPPKPADAPPAPAAPKDGIEAKPAAKEKTGFDEEWTPEVEAKLRKLYPEHKMWRVKDIVENKYKSSEAALKSKLAELEARPQTPTNDAKIAELEKLIGESREEAKTWRQRVEEEAFTRGETYRKEYVLPYQSEIARGIAEVAGTANTPAMTVTEMKNGEEVTRPATPRDFQKLLKMEPEEWDIETDKFGRGKQRVIARMLRISDIREREQQARDDYSANYEKNKTERELAAKRQREDYDKAVLASHSEFEKDPEMGKYIAASETDPEGTQLFKTELERFDNFQNVQVTPRDAAEVRSRFAMVPRLLKEAKAKDSKIASLEADLAKLRGADPGAPVKTVTGAPPAEEPKGIDGLMAKMDWGGKQ